MSKLLKRYEREWTTMMMWCGHNPIWYRLVYGEKKGDYLYRVKNQSFEKRLRFLEKRIRQLRKGKR